MNLNLYDADLNRIAIIGEQYISCLWSEGYNTIENFSLELIATDEYKRKISVESRYCNNFKNHYQKHYTNKINEPHPQPPHFLLLHKPEQFHIFYSRK